jgi:hypothetical protein
VNHGPADYTTAWTHREKPGVAPASLRRRKGNIDRAGLPRIQAGLASRRCDAVVRPPVERRGHKSRHAGQPVADVLNRKSNRGLLADLPIRKPDIPSYRECLRGTLE